MGKGTSIEITADDQYLFAQGTHYDIYKKLGARNVKIFCTPRY